jgi:hypothetical protein
MTLLMACATASLSLLSGTNAMRGATLAIGELPTVQYVLDRFVQVTGGRDAWLRHKSITIHGRYRVPAKNLEVEMISYSKDGKVLQIAKLAAGDSQSGYDGRTAWDMDADGKVSIWEGDEVKSIARDADMYYHNGHSCYHLKGTNNWGKMNEQFYDRRSGLLIGYAYNTAWRGGNGAATATFEDYRDFGAVLMAVKTTTRDGNSLSIFSITSISYDDVDDSVFALPQPVRAALQPGRSRRMLRLARPIAGTTIMGMDPRFLVAAEECHGVIGRRIFDRLARQVDGQLRLRPIDIINPFRRDDHVVA